MKRVENRLMYVDELMNFSHLLANQCAALDFELPVGFQLSNKADSTGTGWLKTVNTLGRSPRIKLDLLWVFDLIAGLCTSLHELHPNHYISSTSSLSK